MNELRVQPEGQLNPGLVLDIMKKGLFENYTNSQEVFDLVSKGFAKLKEIAVSPMADNKKLPPGSFNRFLFEVSDDFIEELKAIKANRENAHSKSGGAMPESSLVDQNPNSISEVDNLIAEIERWQKSLQ